MEETEFFALPVKERDSADDEELANEFENLDRPIKPEESCSAHGQT